MSNPSRSSCSSLKLASVVFVDLHSSSLRSSVSTPGRAFGVGNNCIDVCPFVPNKLNEHVAVAGFLLQHVRRSRLRRSGDLFHSSWRDGLRRSQLPFSPAFGLCPACCVLAGLSARVLRQKGRKAACSRSLYGRSLEPISHLSASRAAPRPSLMAQTTRL